MDKVMVTQEELLPCPFCGGPASEVATLVGCLPCAIGRRNAASWNTRLSPAPEGVDAKHMSPEMAEVCGIVSAMHTKWMQREELMRQDGGLDLMVRMADLLDGIVDAVPKLQRKFWAALTPPPKGQSDEQG